MKKVFVTEGPVFFCYLIVILFECGLCDFKHSADGFVYTDKKYELSSTKGKGLKGNLHYPFTLIGNIIYLILFSDCKPSCRAHPQEIVFLQDGRLTGENIKEFSLIVTMVDNSEQ